MWFRLVCGLFGLGFALAGCPRPPDTCGGEAPGTLALVLRTRSCPGVAGPVPDALTDVTHLELVFTSERGSETRTVPVDGATVVLEGLDWPPTCSGGWTLDYQVLARSGGETGPVRATGGGCVTLTPQVDATAEVWLRPVDTFVNQTNPVNPNQCTALNVPRANHSATLLPSGKVLIAGGATFDASGSRAVLDSIELFDPVAGTFELRSAQSGGLVSARSGHTAARVGKAPFEEVVLIGGTLDAAGVPTSQRSAERFDAAEGTPAVPAIAHQARARHAAATVDGNFVLVAGGSNNPATGAPSLRSTEAYDVLSGQFVPGSDLPESRRDACAATLFEDHLVALAGGVTDDGTTAALTPDLLFLQLNARGLPELVAPGGALTTFPLGTPRQFPGCATAGLDDGILVIAGGYTRPDLFDATSASDRVEHVYPTTNATLAEGPPLTKARGRGCLVATRDDGFVYVGGFVSDDAGAAAVAEQFAWFEGGLTAPTPVGGGMNTPRFDHACTRLKDGAVLVTGGRTPDGTGAAPSTTSVEIYTPLVRE